ncbi:MAG: uracil-DNA glycosylase [Gammaproteobacteria bacterium]|nr:uracil-DNA glycosylase [Gammaproteobacteria bacterium]
MQESTRQQYLQAMGIQLWESRWLPEIDEAGSVAVKTGDIEPESLMGEEPVVDIKHDYSGLGWSELQSKVESCENCHLHESRIYPVFGAGDQNAKVMLIGEAPGAEEDRQGEPFIGQAGQLLNQMLLAIGFKREHVYITNILKCRPPNNRDPETKEINSCESYLHRQITLVAPELVVALGRVAAQSLLKSSTKLGDLRGQLHQVQGLSIPVLVTYHPAYLLKNPLEKRKAWEDLKFVLANVSKGKNE